MRLQHQSWFLSFEISGAPSWLLWKSLRVSQLFLVITARFCVPVSKADLHRNTHALMLKYIWKLLLLFHQTIDPLRSKTTFSIYTSVQTAV